MLNPKSYIQLLTSFKSAAYFTPAFFSTINPPPKTTIHPNNPRRPTQKIIKKLSQESEKNLNKPSHSPKTLNKKIPRSETPKENEPKTRRLSDMINVKEPQKDPKVSKNDGRGPRKDVDPQTVYYNIRKKLYENPIRQKKYFKEEDILKEEKDDHFLDEESTQKKLYRCQTVEQVLRMYHGYKFSFSVRNLVTTIHRLARYLPVEHKQHKKQNEKLKVKKAFPYKSKEKRIQSLLFAIEDAKDSISPTDKMIVVWALTRMRYNEIDAYVKLVEDVFASLKEIKSDQLALLAWCLSRLGSRNPKYYGMISLELEKRIEKMIESGCFMVQEAYIEKENLPQRKKGIISIEKDEEMQENESEDEWAEMDDFADKEEEVEVEESLEGKKPIKADELLSAHGMSLILWSFCKRNVQDENLFAALEKLFIQDIRFFSAQQIANVIYGLTSVGKMFSQEELDVIKKRLGELDLAEVNSLTLKTIVYTVNKMGVEDQELYKKYIKQFLEANKGNLSPRFTCDILRVLVERRIYDLDFFAKINNFVIKNIRFFNLEDCLSAFESFIKLFNVKGGEIAKTEKYSIRTTLDILVTRMDPYKQDISSKQKGIIKKLMADTKYNSKELEALLV